MKVEKTSSHKRNPARELRLPSDFARRVILRARAEQHQRRVRRRILGVACAVAVLAALPLASFMRSSRDTSASHEPPVAAQPDWMEHADEYQPERETSPDQVGDYLLPNAAAVHEFAAAYTDESWQYDPSWSYYPGR